MIPIPPGGRDFTVAVFVVHGGKTLLHPHARLGMWLPPGGHIEPNELPDDAARREVLEETGLAIELVGERGVTVDDPRAPVQLVRPLGIQLENIGMDHEHIDLIYLARLAAPPEDGWPEPSTGMRWVGLADLAGLDLTAEVRAWVERCLALAGCQD